MPSKPVQELRQEVARLRAEGLSFSQIAKKLAISKSYAVKLSQSDRSPESDTGHKNGHYNALTLRQRRFATGLIEGKTQREAAIDAGVPQGGADSFAQRTLNDRRFQETFSDMLDRMGLSEQQLAQVHRENLEAVKYIVERGPDGSIRRIVEKPDYATRQRAVKDGWGLRGRIGPSADDEGDRGRPLQINILYQTAKKVERLVGRKIIPDEWEEMMQNGANGDGAITAALPSASEVQDEQARVEERSSESPESAQAEVPAEDEL